MTVTAHTIFRDKFFNGDPHPGNILLLNDGKLGLIDFGQVGGATNESLQLDVRRPFLMP